MFDIRKPLFLSVLEKYLSMFIQFAVSMIVARLLTPEQFGVFAVAYAIVGFAQIIREMGINSYIIQKKDLSERDVRACLFLTCSVAWLLAAVLFMCAPFIADLYGEDVRSAVYVLLLNFIIMPISSTIFAVLQREMRFDLLLRVNIAGAFANGGCAILLAAHGFGSMSLAWACVAGQLASAVVAGAYRPTLQHFLPSYAGVGEVFRFGCILMAGTLLQQVSTNIANLITARFVSLEAMGLFSRSQSVSGLFGKLIMDGIQPLMLPMFAQIKRKEMDTGASFERAFSYIAVLTWPLFGFLAVCAPEIIVVMFGEQWQGAAVLLQMISIGGLFWVIQPIANPLMIALGHVKSIVRIQAINQFIALTGVVAAAMHGIEAVAMAAIPISAAHACMWLYAAFKSVPVRADSLVREACICAAITAIALVLPVAVVALADAPNHFETLALAATGAAVGWLIGVFVCRHPISAEMLRLLLQLRRSEMRQTRVRLAKLKRGY